MKGLRDHPLIDLPWPGLQQSPSYFKGKWYETRASRDIFLEMLLQIDVTLPYTCALCCSLIVYARRVAFPIAMACVNQECGDSPTLPRAASRALGLRPTGIGLSVIFPTGTCLSGAVQHSAIQTLHMFTKNAMNSAR